MINRRLYFNISELNLLLIGTSAFSCGLVVLRVLWTLQPTYISLIWNLFLAWIPYILSYILRKKHETINNKMILAGWVLLWLVFYPNAPYIITDLFHLNEKDGAPLWFDLVLIFSFAGNGLILGLLSLRDMHNVISQKTNVKKGWWFATAILLLSGFGVYMGRYLRWNSWDVLASTNILVSDLWHIATQPHKNARAYGFTLLFGLFQILIYYSFSRFINLLKKSTV